MQSPRPSPNPGPSRTILATRAHALTLLLLLLATAAAAITTPSHAAAPRLHRDRVEPRWFADNSRFWYRNHLPAEAREFVLVNTSPARRAPAFDHARVARELSTRLNRTIAPDHLPIDQITFADDLSTVTLSGPDGTWRVALPAYEFTPVQPLDDDALPAETEIRPSRSNGPETSILFDNRSSSPVSLFWIDPEGNRQPYGSVDPGRTRRQHTFTGHVWAAFRDTRLLAVFEATRDSGRAIIEERPTSNRRARRNATNSRPAPARETPSPDGSKIAFVRDHNLWIRDARSGTETALSFDANPGHSFRRDTQRARLVGMDYDTPEAPPSLPEAYWSPDSRRLVALQTRTIPERRVHLIESSPSDQLQPRTSSYPYLKAGDELPAQSPRLFDTTTASEIPVPRDLFPNPWDLGEFRWAPDGSRFTFLYNQRGHQVLRLLAIDPVFGNVSTLVEESSPTFIDYSNKTHLTFLDASGELLWMSERSGWNHLHLAQTSPGANLLPVTRGPWLVRGVDHIDPARRIAWLRIAGFRPDEDPYHIHLARVNLDGSGFTVLTEGDGTHEITWSPDRRFFIDTWSRVDLPPVSELRNGETGALLCHLETADASEIIAARGRFPERFAAMGRDGSTLIWGILHRPRDFDPSRRFPVIENIYAGPHGQHVPKSFRTAYRHQEEIADRGFVVVQIDGMGTNWRSKRFHDVAWRNLADAGFPDRIAWLKAAAQRFPELDLDRVGIYGGSAGGQNAMRALIAHGDFYKAAVADCGCHDNRMDKIWWNEAWMGWPVASHYTEQSNVTQAHRLQGRLLLTVGELDRNVDPASTLQAAAALVKAGKPFEFMLFPGAGHGAIESDYGRRLRADFFVRNLAPAP